MSVSSHVTPELQTDTLEKLPQPYLLFLGDVIEPGYAKTAFGLRDWARERCVGEFALPDARVSTGLPVLHPVAAAERGARSLVIGVANLGGIIPENWLPALLEALDAGLDLISGMHVHLVDIPVLRSAADRLGRRLIDIRRPPAGIQVASGAPRSGRCLLTVGTDCGLGKKYTALALTRGLRGRGVDVDFRATGQTGIIIVGRGIPIDAVVSDFLAGAAEILSPAAASDHLDVIEGQGSLFHPSYAGVTLGLLHGSQPDLFVVCHEPGRATVLWPSRAPIAVDRRGNRFDAGARQPDEPGHPLCGDQPEHHAHGRGNGQCKDQGSIQPFRPPGGRSDPGRRSVRAITGCVHGMIRIAKEYAHCFPPCDLAD
jgi:uncharacterized NAD-dependent epimerase/dehydratase family protein